jgi:hypothetical protein
VRIEVARNDTITLARPQIALAGGELPVGKGLFDIEDFSGAAQCADHKWRKRMVVMKRENRGAVEVSIDAGRRETYASCKGADVYDRVVENILRYRESGPIKLKYIAAACNISDADIDGFVDLAQRARPISIMVTPEYGESWSKQYDETAVGQIAKLINKLRASGLRTQPRNAIGGKRIFPDFWESLAPQLSMNKNPSALERLANALRM